MDQATCFVCGSKKVVLLFRSRDRLYPDLPGEFAMQRCQNCGLSFLHPQPEADVLNQHYPDHYTAYQGVSGSPLRTGRKFRDSVLQRTLALWLGYGRKNILWGVYWPYSFRIAYYPRYVKDGYILDVGCGSGKFLLAMRGLGWRTMGIDISKKAVEAATRVGGEARLGSLTDVRFDDSVFHAITMHHVFEHVPNPKETLREAHRILRTGGELIITVPNTRSLSARLFGRHWFGWEIPRHANNYNRRNITALLQGAGFRVEAVVFTGIFDTFLSSFAYWWRDRSALPIPALGPVGRLLGAAGFILDPFAHLVSLGDAMTVRVRK